MTTLRHFVSNSKGNFHADFQGNLSKFLMEILEKKSQEHPYNNFYGNLGKSFKDFSIKIPLKILRHLVREYKGNSCEDFQGNLGKFSKH